MSRISFVTSENWREKSTRYLPHPSYTLLLPLDIPQTPSEIPRHSHITPDISKTLPKHSWHSTEIFWHPHFSQSPFWHPLTTQMALRLSDECWGVVKAVPGGQGNMFQVLGGVLECPGVFWGSWWCWGCMGGCGRCPTVFSLQFSSVLGNHLWDLCNFTTDLEVPNVSNIKISQCYGNFDLLGSLCRGFRAELQKFTLFHFCWIIL